MLYQGQTFSTQEATTVFFSTTKLFQNKDPALRQMVYLLVKELAELADDVMMATSTLTRDINTQAEDLFSGGGPLAQIGGFRFGGSSAVGALQALGAGSGASSPTGTGSIIGTSVNHRANALRALCKVTDVRSGNLFEEY